MEYPRWKGSGYKRAESGDDLPPYVCKKHGPDPDPVVYKRKNGYIHRRCRKCYKVIHDPLNKAWYKQRRRGARERVIAAYGGRCECCGEHREAFLTIDHIRYDEPSHKGRKRNYGSANTIYIWLEDNGMPRDGYALACYNCNLGRARNKGICPHVEESGDLTPQKPPVETG